MPKLSQDLNPALPGPVPVPRFVHVRKELRKRLPDPGALYQFEDRQSRYHARVRVVALAIVTVVLAIGVVAAALTGIALAALWQVFVA